MLYVIGAVMLVAAVILLLGLVGRNVHHGPEVAPRNPPDRPVPPVAP